MKLMKRFWLGVIATAMVLPAKAQLFSPESFTGAALGAVAGAVIGHNSGRHGGEGAAIGAGIGYVLGNVAHNNRQYREGDGYNGNYSSPAYSSISFGYSSTLRQLEK